MEIIEAEFTEVETKVLIDRVELPDLSDIKNEALQMSAGVIVVVDQESNDRAGLIIKDAAAFIKRVDDLLEPITRPLIDAKRATDELKKQLKRPAEVAMQYHKDQCLAWQKSEAKRLQAEREAAVAKALEDQKKREAEQAEALKMMTPFDDPTELVLSTPEPNIATVVAMPTKAASSFTGLKKGPVKIQLVDMNDLVQAAAKDKSLQQYLSIDEKMLTAWAKKVGVEKFDIPGVKATQDDILSRK